MAVPTRGSLVTGTFAFAATDFQNYIGVPGPTFPTPAYPTVGGNFTVTFDLATPLTKDTTAGLTVSSLTPGVLGSGTYVEYRFNATIGGGTLTFGGSASGASGLDGFTGDFSAVFTNFLTGYPTLTTFELAEPNGPGTAYYYLANSLSATVTPSPLPVPEPATAGVVAAGLIGLAGSRRRRAVPA